MSTQQLTEVKPFVMTGASAVGKGTLTAMLFAKYPAVFGKKISTTTRQPRVGEENGVHYHFITMEEFLAQEAAGQFVETASIHGNKYGTSVSAVIASGAGNKIPLLELDVQGVASVKLLNWANVQDVVAAVNAGQTKETFTAEQLALPAPLLDTNLVWIAPPTPESLIERLTGRGTETPEQIQKRLETAKFELTFADQYGCVFDKVIVNDVLEEAFAQLEQYLFELYPQVFQKTE